MTVGLIILIQGLEIFVTITKDLNALIVMGNKAQELRRS